MTNITYLQPYEREEVLRFELETEAGIIASSIKILVRVWHDDYHGMSAEPLAFRLGASHCVKIGLNPMLDKWIKDIVDEAYPQETLDVIRDADPIFASLAYEEPVISSETFRHMKGV